MAKGEESMSDFLEQWVIHDGKPITARLLSTLKRCHISTAHENMMEFHNDMSKRGSEFTPFTCWIIKGPLKAAPKAAVDSQTSIDSMDVDEYDNARAPLVRESLFLVTQEKLKETEAEFERITVKQVYSFSPRLPASHTEAHKVAAVSQLTTIQHDLHTNKDYIDTWESTGRGAELGTIQSAEKWGDSGQPSLGPSTAAGPSKPAATASVIKKEPVKEGKKEEKKATGKPVKREEGLNFAKAKAGPKSKRKLVESDEEEEESAKEVDRMDEGEDGDDEDAGPIGYAIEASEKEQSKEATKGGKAVRKRADAGDKLSKDEEKRRRQKQELMDMMDEDEEEAGNADPPAIKPAETASTSMMKGTEDSAASSMKGKEEGASTTAGPKKRVRKQRKVIRKVKTKDSKGYTKTQDVEEYESYSSDESDAPAPPLSKSVNKKAAQKEKPAQKEKEAPPMVKTNSGSGAPSAGNAASKKGTTAGAAAGGQRKLASFFTKK